MGASLDIFLDDFVDVFLNDFVDAFLDVLQRDVSRGCAIGPLWQRRDAATTAGCFVPMNFIQTLPDHCRYPR
jgi:hypothetical protein